MPAAPRRRWLRYSLRTLLVLMTALCVWLGIAVKRAADQKRAVELIESITIAPGVESMNQVFYDRDKVQNFSFNRYGYDFEFDNYDFIALDRPPSDSRFADWFREKLGRHYVDTATAVILREGPDSGSFVECLQSLERLPKLRVLSAWIDLRPETLAALVRLKQIEVLHLNVVRAWRENLGGADYDQSALSCLAELPNVLELWLTGDYLTSDCVENLSGLSNIEKFHLLDVRRGSKGLKSLSNLSGLELLDLRADLIDGTFLNAISELPQLKQLIIQRVADTETIDPQLLDRIKHAAPHVEVKAP